MAIIDNYLGHSSCLDVKVKHKKKEYKKKEKKKGALFLAKMWNSSTTENEERYDLVLTFFN